MTTNTEFQVMPELDKEEFAALLEDIRVRGVLVPVLRDERGRLVDGHHRVRAAAELGIEAPAEFIVGKTDEELRDLAFGLNLNRRHLTRTQKRELIAREISARPGDSDRAIGRRLGCDHKTVGAVRRELSGEFPHPEPAATSASREEAEVRAAKIRDLLDQVFAGAVMLAVTALAGGITVTELIGAVTIGMHTGLQDEMTTGARAAIWDEYIGFLIRNGNEITPTKAALTPAERNELLGRLTECVAAGVAA